MDHKTNNDCVFKQSAFYWPPQHRECHPHHLTALCAPLGNFRNTRQDPYQMTGVCEVKLNPWTSFQALMSTALSVANSRRINYLTPCTGDSLIPDVEPCSAGFSQLHTFLNRQFYHSCLALQEERQWIGKFTTPSFQGKWGRKMTCIFTKLLVTIFLVFVLFSRACLTGEQSRTE